MRDLKHALRSLGRSPGFVSVAIVALGIGLGRVPGAGPARLARRPHVHHPRGVT